LVFFFLLSVSIIAALPPIDDLRNAVGKPLPANIERVGANQYSRLISRDNAVTLRQNYFVYDGIVRETLYFWVGDVKEIEWEIWDFLESLGTIEHRGNLYGVVKNGYSYILQPIKQFSDGTSYVQLTVSYE
jgi:hypothetical protein